MTALNNYRAKHNSPPLVWGTELAARAQEWADHLAARDVLDYDTRYRMGQTIMFYQGGTLMPQFTADTWYDQIHQYDFNNPKFSSKTSSFVQIVWKATTHVGVGRAVTDDFKTYVVVNYIPVVYFRDQYEENVQPPS